MVTAVAFAVAIDALEHWRGRLAARGVAVTQHRRFGDAVLAFSDPHGLPLELVGSEEIGSAAASPGITGFHSATTTVAEAATRRLLENTMGMVPVGQEGRRQRFEMGTRGQPGRYYDVVVAPEAPAARAGPGTVHHIAFRTDDDAGQARWQRRLAEAGIPATGVRDRKYLKRACRGFSEGLSTM
jgi:glyoxalase family protein